MAFGGSGPIHAAGLARELGISRVIVPALPGLFSALGLLFSGIEHHDVRSCLLSGPDLTAAALRNVRDEMRRNMLAQFKAEGFPRRTGPAVGCLRRALQGTDLRDPLGGHRGPDRRPDRPGSVQRFRGGARETLRTSFRPRQPHRGRGRPLDRPGRGTAPGGGLEARRVPGHLGAQPQGLFFRKRHGHAPLWAEAT